MKEAKGQQNKRGGVDVLCAMVVTFAVFHLEMSALNAEVPQNAVGGCRCRVMVDTIQKKEHRENVKIKAMGVSEENSSERSKGQQNKRGGMDVLSSMLVTAAVFHLERSALNANADKNAVEVLSMPWWSQSKIKVEEERRKKKWVRKQKSMKDKWNGRTNKWTYCFACSSPPPCSTWKGPR